MFQTGQKKIEVHAPDTVHASIVSTFTETSGSLNQMKLFTDNHTNLTQQYML